MRRLFASNVLISGTQGLGVEIAKNLILAGVKYVTLHDEGTVELWDLSSNFVFSENDLGKNRVVASVSKLQELNNAELVVSLTTKLTKEQLCNFQVVDFLLQNMYFHLAWSLQSIINEESVSDASLTSLLSKRDTLLQELGYFVNLVTDNKEEGKLGGELACRVCTILSETWFLFRTSNFSKTELERLGYQPDAHMLQKFWELCRQQLNNSDEVEDEDVNKEYTEETNRDNVMMAAAKLIACDVVPKEYLAPEIFSHFVLQGTSVAEIVKNLITT